MKCGDKVMISPSPTAKGRTKNRLREHGDEGFIVEQISHNTSCLANRPALLLRSTEWFGWLPTDEINTEVV